MGAQGFRIQHLLAIKMEESGICRKGSRQEYKPREACCIVSNGGSMDNLEC